MILQNMLLAIALTLQGPWYPESKRPETDQQRADRIAVITEAIALEAAAQESWQWGTDTLAAATLATFFAESRFALEVHNGQGKTRHGEDQGRAKCLGQLHATGYVPRSEWKTLAGTDLESTRRCARATMRVLAGQAKRCKMGKELSVWSVARLFAMYQSGKSCNVTKSSMMRARHWGRIMRDFAKQTEVPQQSVPTPQIAPTPLAQPASPTTARLD
jgi:hypothetical protein